MAILQTRPPRLWATKIRGRDDALQLALSVVRSCRRFVAWSISRFDDATDFRTMYAS